MRRFAIALSALILASSSASAQTPYQLNPDTPRVTLHYRLAWEAFRVEHWDEAVKEFKQVLEIDSTYKLAYYGLGRSYMGLKRFSEATAAYERCHQLYEGEGAEKFRSVQEADTIRQADLDQLKLAINSLSQRASSTGVTPSGTANQLRQLRDQAQRIQNKRDALNDNVDIGTQVPAFVSLALGSAYFRATRFADAEKAFKDALEVDPKSGEAWNNLAALYLFTNRIDEADRALSSAEKVGYAVNPDMKTDIKKRKSGS
jgi:tetratricopeptide (TPR) repeat protein